jgi:hypothetical protein
MAIALGQTGCQMVGHADLGMISPVTGMFVVAILMLPL